MVPIKSASSMRDDDGGGGGRCASATWKGESKKGYDNRGMRWRNKHDMQK